MSSDFLSVEYLLSWIEPHWAKLVRLCRNRGEKGNHEVLPIVYYEYAVSFAYFIGSLHRILVVEYSGSFSVQRRQKAAVRRLREKRAGV